MEIALDVHIRSRMLFTGDRDMASTIEPGFTQFMVGCIDSNLAGFSSTVDRENAGQFPVA